MTSTRVAPVDRDDASQRSERPHRRATATVARAVAAVLAALLIVVSLDVVLLQSRLHHLAVVRTTGAPGESWLVVGADSRADLPAGASRSAFGSTAEVGGSRADVVLVVHRTPDGATVTLSLPRDLLVHDAAGEINRLALTYDVSPQNLVDSVCTTLGVPTDHLVVVDFAAFDQVVDALGGVQVTLPAPTRDTYSGLARPGGSQLLHGDQALALVRSRHPEQYVAGRWSALPDGAAQRTAWAGVLFQQISTAATSSGAFRAHRLAWIVTGSMATDQHTSLPDLARLAEAVGPAIDVPAQPVPGGLALTTSARTFDVLTRAGFDRNCRTTAG